MTEHGQKVTTTKDSEVDFTSAQKFMESEEIKTRLSLIDESIEAFIDEKLSQDSILYETAKYLLRAGGKRFRSLLSMLCCEAVGGDVKDILPFAIAAELVQTASLIHDDIVDEDTTRRGVETAHKKFGNKIAIIAGDLLIALAIQTIGEYSSTEMLKYIAGGGIKMCEGEAADLLLCESGPEDFGSKEYFRMIELKTVSFVKEAARIGALVGKGSEKQIETLLEYAENVGYAFQIRDDILDVISDEEDLGKSTFSDIRKQRCNFPIVHALETLSSEKRMEFLDALRKSDVLEVMSAMEDTGSLHKADALVRGYTEKAKSALKENGFANNVLLFQLAEFVSTRKN